MNSTVSLTSADHEAALRNARSITTAELLGADGLNAPDFDRITLWADRVWDEFESAIRNSFRTAGEIANEAFEACARKIVEASDALKSHMNDLKDLVLERLNAYVQSMIESAYKRLHSEIQVGSVTLSLLGIKVSQSISVGGSLEGALSSAMRLASEGSIVVDANYGLISGQ